MSAERDRAEELLADVLPKASSFGAESLDRIRQVARDASADAARYAEAEQELEEVEAEISALVAEREELPERAYLAMLEEDDETEEKLKDRYKQLRPAIEALEDRRGSLKGELAALLRNPKRHRYDVAIERLRKEARAAHREREALEGVRKRILATLDSALGPVVEAHEQARATNESLGKQREWDESPVGRGAILR